MRRSKPIGAIAAAVAGAALLLAPGAAAQAPAPTVTVTMTATSVTIDQPAVAAGPTRLVFRNANRRRPVEGTLVALRPGRTIDELRVALRRAVRGPGPLKAVATFEGGGFTPANETYTTTVDLRPGTYVVAAIGDDPPRAPLAQLAVSDEAGSGTRPEPVAAVELFDYAFGMGDTLPRRGVVRLTNRGTRLHFAAAFPLRRGASRTAALQALVQNRPQPFSRLVDGSQAIELLGVVSGGTVNDVEVSFPRAGTWVLACLLSDGEPGNPPHNSIGMVRAFTVR
jgi:hypothetical protein